ncbi:MAG: 16S rRNA (cytosine(1402)-N(4))-methyltransferase RsmH [Bacteroidetes Order II. Incertae sedis bacterium]|jgi:16S rRNA (cytosine1402-N4)-methyltransferase|nr:16S rRNA (cytosine(1402)-N(4))-methyltransferase RsmH [Bacteroidetes Order II. bacterium]MBT4603267.1 16S rRNA (cytosine(1402)-N(4))-methyltransferase RsmH [Bacteroidetes Order II. bacterium]MBT5250876.1 16S rRNA (cytosine(1402)-N(4))-methyltransferase RsmH [Bacteroidetes Order II. bacterium]MBT6199613.1 16S rRNA (cytosine(1402)-N(4))-methyltransferase RsmH [Bacteroidetes Order II. bacterium]MBT6425193.1 16S rRNA (cytosine(1402)-N(4))-methyltransferase RsmH [Bacteroidetes Order II. bacterium
MNYASGYHAPVLCNAVLKGLITRTDGVYVDGTLGGGGHTAAMLDELGASGRVFAIDRDDDAIAEASTRLTAELESGRLTILRGNFSEMGSLLEEKGVNQVDGILLDLGVSSHQLDEADRGFSHRLSGPLDMRMDQSQDDDAADLVNQLEEDQLANVIYQFGEERRSRRIARAIVRARPILSTEQLADVVRSAAERDQRSKTLARVFQALRIAVNGELDALDETLLRSTNLLHTGGRLAIISYHSLEDRRAKHFMRSGNLKGEILKDFFGNRITPWKEITRKAIVADESEVEQNPRSRSARLRIAERVEDSAYSVKSSLN